MSEQTLKTPSSPTRPSHQISRSITEISPPSTRLHRPHHHHHHHHSPNVHSRRARSSDKHREREKGEPQSAYPSSQPFLNGNGERGWREGVGFVKSEAVTPAGSRDVSRRTSLWESDGGLGLGNLGKRAIKDEEVKEEKERSVLRARELRNSLINLTTLSNSTTRRLDNTYYTVLEKLSTLQASIVSLKELSNMTRAVHASFTTDSSEVITEINNQITTFQDFTTQEQQISSLQERVQKGREKIATLAERVEVVKTRVERWERAEHAWQDRTRKRLKILWIFMSVTGAIVIALVVFRYTPARTHGPGVLKGLDVNELRGKIPDFEGTMNESWSLKRKRERGKVLEALKKKGGELGEEPRLRAFDEL